MLNMDDHNFSRHFHVTKPQFEYLMMKLQDNGIEQQHSQGLPPVPATKKVLMFLWFMANQNSFWKVHDARMLRASDFYMTWQEKMGDNSLLGDSAYIGQAFPFFIMPKRDNGALTEADKLQTPGSAFGIMKFCRWRHLRDLQNTQIDTVVMIAACFLHNMCNGASEICQKHPNGCPRQADENE
ncbi:protein ALP1-like [Xyrichtys novacula]|uniref:Protein ALP1-like n=1 Tax=Xyrichtys novacula TaxID=13765 RepID=A0AAV1H5A6_XYRNO|nr:protein ALP1-like [Xyrichtys novacula]